MTKIQAVPDKEKKWPLITIVVFTILSIFVQFYYIIVWRVPDRDDEAKQVVRSVEDRINSRYNIPDENNAWKYYNEACEKYHDPYNNSGGSAIYWSPGEFVLNGIPEGEMGRVDKFLKSNEKTLQLADEGLKRSSLITPYMAGDTESIGSIYSATNNISQLFILSGDCEKKNGNAKKAVQRYLQALHISTGFLNSIGRGGDFTRIGIERIVSIIKEGNDPALLRHMISQLKKILTNRTTVKEFAEFMLFVSCRNPDNNYYRGRYRSGLLGRLPIPDVVFAKREAKITQSISLEVINLLNEPPYKAFSKIEAVRLPACYMSGEITRDMARSLKMYFLGFETQWLEIDGLLLLAGLKLYRLEKGEYPDNLDALVPDVLDKLPVDPFTPDGKFKYIKQGKNNILLYSIGADLTDNQGRKIIDSDQPGGDIVIFEDIRDDRGRKM